MKIFDRIDLEIFGESHSAEIGCVLKGLPMGQKLDMGALREFQQRRKSGKYAFSTPRREKDEVIFDSGVENGIITGTIRTRIVNRDIRPQDYSYYSRPRPSHADYASRMKYGQNSDVSGGGRFSGRMTAPLVTAGGIAKQLLKKEGIEILAFIKEIAGVSCQSAENGRLPSREEIAACHSSALPMPDSVDEAVKRLKLLASEGDSAGGIVQCVVFGAPAGLGDCMCGGLESKLSAAMFGIPAVKGVEFGAGFGLARMKGSSANDPFVLSGGKVATATNNSGGINGGISNGMPVVFNTAFRPTPSISLPQRTVDLDLMKETEINIAGRHDVTVVPRAVAAVEAAAALVILDEILTAWPQRG